MRSDEVTHVCKLEVVVPIEVGNADGRCPAQASSAVDVH